MKTKKVKKANNKYRKFATKKHYIVSLLMLILAVIFFVIALMLLTTWKETVVNIGEVNGFDYINEIGLLKTLNFGPEILQIGIILGLIVAPLLFVFSCIYCIFIFLIS